MLTDQVITVDEADTPTGGASKAAAHRFIPGSATGPAGRLHRAFSVFLFDAGGRLLLQRRADSKITFPGVWTNTCCSHQLHGQDPPEVDDLEDVVAGRAPGAAAAAVRKLEHELGIPRGAVPPSAFKFLTRLHYCAPDPGSGERGKNVVEGGSGAGGGGGSEGGGAGAGMAHAATPAADGDGGVWGEHEIDYVLLARLSTPGEALPLAPNPDEVGGTAWVDRARLEEMMSPGSGLAWSPWFRIIARTWLLPAWWADLDAAVGSDAYVDAGTVHRVDC
jgi:isopentenyl-diphosphate delta-isomerase